MITERRSYPFVSHQLPAIVWACLIFAASSIASSRIPDLSIFRFDKVIHFGIYFTLAFLVYRAFRNQSRFPALARHAYLFTLVAIALYGASDEFHQSFVPGRDCDIFDLLADAAGGTMLIALVWIKERFFTDSPPN